MRTLDDLVVRTHAAMREKGWWPERWQDRPPAEVFANWHAEISEAWELFRAGRIQLDHNDGKPEGFWVDVADLVIRIADFCGAAGLRPQLQDAEGLPPDIVEAFATYPALVMSLHLSVADAGALVGCDWKLFEAEGYSQDFEAIVAELLTTAFVAASKQGVDLWDLIETKEAYNRTRAFRHGNKQA